ncbi:MAG: TOBE domain-containing protein [Paracoccaceae bacterium]
MLPEGEAGAPLTVKVAERLGDRASSTAACRTGPSLVSRIPGRSQVAPGQVIQIGFDPDAAHIFGADGRAWHHEEG